MLAKINGPKQKECEFCDTTYDEYEYVDTVNDGWFCESCDGFNSFAGARQQQDQLLVILEDKASVEGTKTVKYDFLRKQLSPFRYPGGKSRMIDYLYEHLYKNKVETLYSPFAGGSAFELAMIESGVVNKLILNDLDFGIYSTWWTIKNFPDELIYRIEHAEPTHKDYFKAQQQIKEGFIGMDCLDAAWATLLVNRLAYSGISKANPLGGRLGSKEQLLSRWNPTKLIQSIKKIHAMSDKIEIHCLDAFEFMIESYWDNNGLIFIDPPYIEKGADLYNIAMTLEQHEKLAFHLDLLYQGASGANLVITYDYNKITDGMFNMATDKRVVGRKYSI